MNAKPPLPTREERLAKALRDNLARRKALMRAKRGRAGDESPPPAPDPAKRDEASS